MLRCRVYSTPRSARKSLQNPTPNISRLLTQSAANANLRPEILTLLHKTTTLLPRALAPKSQTSSSLESLEFWNHVLSGTYTDLTTKDTRPAKIVVYGADEWSGAQNLVTALLEEPLTSDEYKNEQIRGRWKDHNQQSLIISNKPSTPGSSAFQTSASYLQQFPIPLEIVELAHTSSPLASESSAALITADIALVVCNPVTTPLSSLLHNPLLTTNPNTILVLTCTSSPESLQTFISRSMGPQHQRLKILCVDPARAMTANEHFKSDPGSSLAVQRYQDNFVGSQVSTVTVALRERFSSGPNPSEVSLRTRTSLAQIQAALSTVRTSLKCARKDMDTVSLAISGLNDRIEEAKVRVHQDVFGRSSASGSKPNVEGDAVVDALQEAGKDVRVVMDRLTWWRMVWRVDEISLIVSQAVQQAWCRDLEKQLILQTGRLTALQTEITKSTFTLLKTQPSPPFNSAILLNSLQQLAALPSYTARPNSLTGPIDDRRAQIIEHPTTRLHVAGQRAVLGMSGGIAAGTGISWAGWLGWLAGSGEGLLGAFGLDAGTAIGVGLLSAVGGVRWAVGKWERSKRRWWEDWNRVGEGLGRDLRVTLDQTMRDNILGVAERGCSGLTEIVVRRKKEIEEIEEELDTLTETLEVLELRTK